MILSKSAEYAVRAVVCLSEAGGETPMSVDAIAARLDVPRNYLSKILHVLAGTEILSSTRGPGGGFALAVPAGELPLSRIVAHFDDLPDDTTCLFGRARCSHVDPCQAHDRWAAVRSSILEFLNGTVVADIAHDGSVAVSDPMT